MDEMQRARKQQTPSQKIKRATRLAKNAAARVKDAKLRQIAYETVYRYVLEH